MNNNEYDYMELNKKTYIWLNIVGVKELRYE